jgi:glycogen synthase
VRLCFVSRRFFPAISGMSVYALNLLRELARAGHDVTMISQYRGDAAGAGVYGGGPPPPVEGVRVIGLEAHGEQDGGDFEADVRTMVATIVEEHRRRPFDVLHAQYAYPTGLAALEASRVTGVPNLVSIQGGDGHWVGSCCGTHRRAMTAVLDHAGALLIGSRSFADEVTERLGTPAGRFTIVPGAVDTDRFRPAGGRPAGPPRLLFHGRLDARKGVLDLLDAVARVAPGRDLRLTVSGIGPDVAAVAARTRELGLEDITDLAGHVAYERVPEVYRDADLFVSPTYAEGFSNTILEAMASGLPIVSTRAVGVVDCLRDGENALLVEPGDVEGLAAAIGRMLDDDAVRRRLALAGLEEARRLYSWRAVGRQVMAVYDRLAGTAPDTGWSLDTTVEPCRFRAAPHLL